MPSNRSIITFALSILLITMAVPRAAASSGASAVFAASGPLNVTVRTDASRATTATIPVTGGTIRVTAANKTKYVLTIPKGALLDPTAITVTPITAIQGLPKGATLAAGVSLLPDGLHLMAPATLLVTPAKPIPLTRQISTGYHAQGESFHLEPLDLSPKKILFHVLSFSGRAMLDARPAVRHLVTSHAPSDVWDRLAQHLTPLFQQAREGTISRERLYTTAVALLRLFHEQTLQPMLQQAATDESLLAASTEYLVEWVREMQLLNVEDRLSAEVKSATSMLWTAIENVGSHCGEKLRFLFYSTDWGWIVDPDTFGVFMEVLRPAALLFGIEAANDLGHEVLANCRPRGFKFANLKVHLAAQVERYDTTYSGRICGSDPSAGPWTISIDRVVHRTYGDHETTGTTQWELDRTYSYTGQAGTETDLLHLSTNPAVMTLRQTVSGSYWQPPDQTVDTPVEEDMSCPAAGGTTAASVVRAGGALTSARIIAEAVRLGAHARALSRTSVTTYLGR